MKADEFSNKFEKKRSEIGVVVSAKMSGAVVVALPRLKRHPLYKKSITRTKKIKALNEVGAVAGQKVMVVETKPISKEIHYAISSIIGENTSKGKVEK